MSTKNIIPQIHPASIAVPWQLTPSEYALTTNVLTRPQIKAGYYLKEDEDFIYIHNAENGDKPLAVLSAMATSDAVRNAVAELIEAK